MIPSSKLSSLLALSLLLFVVLACKSCSFSDSANKEFSFPDDKKDYIGNWRGQLPNGSMKLEIGADGTLNYERKEGPGGKTTSKSVNGKISKFDGNNFEVKVLLVSTTFKVEKPPYRDGKMWKMVVDGVEVSRKDSDEPTIDVAEMRKVDASGEMSSEVTDTFTRSDKKLYCYIDWDNPKTGARFKFAFIAVDAGGAKNKLIDEVKLTAEDEFANNARASLTVRRPLPRGDYKVDIYVNDQLERTVSFKIV